MSAEARSCRGLTLVELVLAIGLASLLFAGLLSLLDTSLTIWDRTEARRDLVEVTSAVGELLERDLAALEGGPRGDLLADWMVLDGDADGRNGAPYPRLRLVRRVTSAELRRLQAGAEVPAPGEGLLEVTWALVPLAVDTPRREVHRVLWRGTRIAGDPETLSHFDRRFLDEGGRAVPGGLDEVASGVLWFGLGFATQTTRFDGDWTFGPTLRDATRSWDAWGAGRADRDEHVFNEPGAGMPDPGELATLPRRVRVELELERPAERRKRTSLRARMDDQDAILPVDDGERLPEPGRHVLVDEEWMLVRSVSGNEATVQRAARGTTALPHEPGAIVHHGQPVIREIPIAAYREDWRL